MTTNPDLSVNTVSRATALPDVDTITIFDWPNTDGGVGQVLTTDGARTLSFTTPSTATGEINTASNVNTAGEGLYKQKTAVDLEFKGIAVGSSKLTLVDTPATNSVDLDVDESELSHLNIGDIGTNSHVQIDSHIASVVNPHTVTMEQARTGGATMSGSFSMGNNTITAVPDPTGALEVANKQYVDSVASGLVVHASVRAATLVAFVGDYDGTPNFTLTANPGAVLPDVDGVTLNVADRLLIKDQVDGKQNGIYVVTDVGNPWILTRASDYDSDAFIDPGDFMFVSEGTTFTNAGFVLTTLTPLLDVTDLVFTQFSGASSLTAGDGLAQVGNAFNVNVDGTGIEINADILRLKDAGVINAKLDKANIPISGFGLATGNVDIGGFDLRALTLTSDVATGTAPLTVSSTTKVTNLYSASTGGLRTATNIVSIDTGAAPTSEGMILETTSTTTAIWTEAHYPHGAYYNTNNSTSTTIATGGTYVKAAGNTVAGILNGFTHTNNRLTCIDTHTHTYLITVSTSVGSDNNTQNLSVVISKNGAVNANLEINTYASVDIPEYYAIPCNALFDLVNTDYIEVWVTDLDNSTNLTVRSMNVTVTYAS
jgi:hypothetical protein